MSAEATPPFIYILQFYATQDIEPTDGNFLREEVPPNALGTKWWRYTILVTEEVGHRLIDTMGDLRVFAEVIEPYGFGAVNHYLHGTSLMPFESEADNAN